MRSVRASRTFFRNAPSSHKPSQVHPCARLAAAPVEPGATLEAGCEAAFGYPQGHVSNPPDELGAPGPSRRRRTNGNRPNEPNSPFVFNDVPETNSLAQTAPRVGARGTALSKAQMGQHGASDLIGPTPRCGLPSSPRAQANGPNEPNSPFVFNVALRT